METETPQPPTPQQPVAAVPAASTTSTSTVIALVLGVLSLACCGFMAGIPAFIIGRSELKGIDEGRLHESNRTMAKIGMILGIVGTILSCLGTLLYILLMVFGLSAGMMESGFEGF